MYALPDWIIEKHSKSDKLEKKIGAPNQSNLIIIVMVQRLQIHCKNWIKKLVKHCEVFENELMIDENDSIE